MDISFYQFERLPPRCLYLTCTLFLYSFEPWNILDLKRSDIRCGQEFFIKKIYPNRVEYFYPHKRTPRRNVNLRLICNQFCGIKLTRHAITRNISLSLGDEITREGRRERDEMKSCNSGWAWIRRQLHSRFVRTLDTRKKKRNRNPPNGVAMLLVRLLDKIEESCTILENREYIYICTTRRVLFRGNRLMLRINGEHMAIEEMDGCE